MALPFFRFSLTPGVAGVFIKPLTGHAEIAVEQVDSQSVLALLAHLVQWPLTHEVQPGVANIVTADRDRLLAFLYKQWYGNKIDSTVTCSHCKMQFELAFDLTALVEFLPVHNVNENGLYKMEDFAFRLPTGEDEIAIQQNPDSSAQDILMNRCLVEGTMLNVDAGVLQEKMKELAPLLNLTLEATCVECGEENSVNFDMQTFLLTKMLQAKANLWSHIHLLAKNYQWSYQSILDIPSATRMVLVKKILGD